MKVAFMTLLLSDADQFQVVLLSSTTGDAATVTVNLTAHGVAVGAYILI
jgi:hypothetical protein